MDCTTFTYDGLVPRNKTCRHLAGWKWIVGVFDWCFAIAPCRRTGLSLKCSQNAVLDSTWRGGI
jgi:hypothetical protein